MNEANSQDAPAYQFIQTPLEFFGHGPELTFGYPPQFEEEIEAAKLEAATNIAELAAYRQELIKAAVTGTAGTESRDYQRLVPVDQFEALAAGMRNKATWDVKRRWSERRKRGNYDNLIDKELHPEAANFFQQRYRPPDNLAVPDAEALSRYLNAGIANNAWVDAYDNARFWYKTLPEDHPDRAVARDYIGFAGNIVLNDYCLTAKAYTNNELADDDFVSVKHLLTVCWPMAHELEEYIPAEVAQKKQFLREVFLQAALNGSEGVRRNAHWLGYMPGETPFADDRAEHEEALLTKMMRFESVDDVQRERVMEQLEAQQKWYRAADLLDLARIAFDLPPEPIQKRIDEIVIAGTLALTNDMNAFEEQRETNHRGHQYVTTNASELFNLGEAPGKSAEAAQKMEEIEAARSLEHQLAQLGACDTEAERNTRIQLFFDRLDRAPVEVARRFADTEAVEAYVELLSHPATTMLYAIRIDDTVESIVRLANKGVVTISQQNQALCAMADNLLERIAAKPADREEFDRIIGYLSPIMRMTKAPEVPADEALWKLMRPAAFAAAMDGLIKQYEGYNDGEEVRLLRQQKQDFLANPRQAWRVFWKIRQEY